jgi:helicase
MCEQMATPVHLDTAVPSLWKDATARGLNSPDWPTGGRMPSDCQLDYAAYAALLRDRITGATLDEQHDHVLVNGFPGIAITTWTDRRFIHQLAEEQTTKIPFPSADDPTVSAHGAALFSRRGDYLATGWLTDYQGIQDRLS